MKTSSTQKTANYIVRYGNIRSDESIHYNVLVDYTRSQAKLCAKRLRLRYEIVHVAKVDFTI